MSILYASEKFSKARRDLLRPRINGEAYSFMEALHECHLGLEDLDCVLIDDDIANLWITTLSKFMNVYKDKDAWLSKAETLSIDDMIQISTGIDVLADWFFAKVVLEED